MLAKSGEVNHTGWGCCQQPFQFTPVILLISASSFFFPIWKRQFFRTKSYFYFVFFCLSRNPVASAERCTQTVEPHTRTHVWSMWSNDCPSLLPLVLFFCAVSFKLRSGTRLIRRVWVSDLTSQCQTVTVKLVPRTSIRTKNTCRRQQDCVRRKVRILLQPRCYV